MGCNYLYMYPKYLLDAHTNGVVQDCSISIANTLEILQSCTKPLIWSQALYYVESCRMTSHIWHYGWHSTGRLWPIHVIWWYRSGSTLAISCCLTTTNHYLNQCWLKSIGILQFQISASYAGKCIIWNQNFVHLQGARELKYLSLIVKPQWQTSSQVCARDCWWSFEYNLSNFWQPWTGPIYLSLTN